MIQLEKLNKFNCKKVLLMSKMSQLQVVCTAVYGVSVIASGLYRFLSEEGGDKGLWFGIVMGSLALIAAVLMAVKESWWFGFGLALLSVLFVGGWFINEAWITKGFKVGPRMHIIIGLSFLELCVLGSSLYLISRRNSDAPNSDAPKK